MKAAVLVKIIDREINPFDASALECAMRICNDVVVLSMVPESAYNELERISRLGVNVIHICDKMYSGSDTLATSKILSQAISKLKPDIVFCGRQSIDSETAQVGSCTAALLGYSIITNVMELPEIENKTVKCRTRLGYEQEKLPCILTFEKIIQLRLPKLFSKSGTVITWNNNNLKLNKNEVGLEGSPTHVLKIYENTQGRRKCKFIGMDELMPLIENLSKVPQDINKDKNKKNITGAKLDSVWTIGDVETADDIFHKVKNINENNPYKIAMLAKQEKPDAILWNDDFISKRNAPIVSALLNTGLCADCKSISTDGIRLLMSRPAGEGSIIAQIECKTKPQCATVRKKGSSYGIVVSFGRGIKDKLEEAYKFAESINAKTCASRGLVDDGYVPYEMQVGLTGKNICSDIYIAIGISGAVHHTCAIENSRFIIAINPDRNARIFDYADYGIIADF